MRERLRQAVLLAVATLAPFAVVEAGLRIAGWHPAIDWYFHGFDDSEPIFRVADGIVGIDPAQREVFRAEPFPVARRPGERRVFSIGDSVTWGHRSNEATGPLKAYSDVLQDRLRAVPGHGADRVVNLGARTFASGRIERVLREALAQSPDVVVASFGSSEFLEAATRGAFEAREARWPRAFWHLRVVEGLESLVARMKGAAGTGLTNAGLRERDGTLQAPFLAPGQAMVDEAVRERVLSAAGERVERMAAACEAKGVPLVLLTVPSNLRWPPVASRYADATERAEVEDVIGRAGAMLDAGRVDEARELLQTRIARSLGVAALRFRRAQVLDRSGDAAGARAEYEAARDLSAFPLRVPGVLNERYREIARRHRGVRLVDVERLFAAAVPDGIPDDRLFLDQNHPTEDGHRRIAEAVLSALEDVP